jgi:curved DNA-binding protein
MDYKDYYSILGVPKTATAADIKKAYRKLARRHHPDQNPGDKGAEQRFKDLNEANEVLSDPEKRNLYDELGSNWESYARAGAGAAGGRGGAAGNPFAGFSGFGGAGARGNVRYEFRSSGDPGEFSDFFRMFFGGAAGAGAASGGAATGGGGPSRASGRRTSAGGAGAASLEDLLAGMGGGSGGFQTTATTGALPPAEAEAEISLEEAFTGTTRLIDVDGKRLEIKIPPGVVTGSRIRLAGKGGQNRDLYIVPRVRPHPVFTRNGADITRDLRVSLREALLGAEIPVGTLTGRVLLTIPSGTQNGRTFRLTGQGMPRLKGDGRGDLYVKVQVVLPTGLSDEAKASAAAFLDQVDQPNPRSET